jgi:hypothetical protein
VDGLVNLAYGQSTLFIDFLAERHGKAALARFLTALGEGTAATPAFTAAFGAFGPEAAAFERSLAPLKSELQPGLYVIQRASRDQPAVLALVGGPALETAVVELLEDGEVSRRRELDLDGAGLLVASLPASLLDGGGKVTLRVTLPLLGVLELDPVSGTRARPSMVSPPPGMAPPASTPLPAPSPVTVPAPARPAPAPAQIPRAA